MHNLQKRETEEQEIITLMRRCLDIGEGGGVAIFLHKKNDKSSQYQIKLHAAEPGPYVKKLSEIISKAGVEVSEVVLDEDKVNGFVFKKSLTDLKPILERHLATAQN